MTNKLDGDINMTYTGIVTPLFVSFTTLILMSFSAKGGNKCKLAVLYSTVFGFFTDEEVTIRELNIISFITGNS